MSKINLSPFDALYNASAKEVRAGSIDRVKARNQRAIDSAIDSAEDQIDTAEEQIAKLTEVVVKGGVVDINKIAMEYRKIKDLQNVIEDIQDFKKDFFKEVVVSGKGRRRVVETKEEAASESKED